MELYRKYRPVALDDVLGQRDAVGVIKGWLKKGREAVPHSILLSGNSGSGKAQPLSAKVLTPFGFVQMRDLQVGDFVVGKDGRPTKVIGVFPQGEKDVYEITTVGGAVTYATADHYWTVRSAQSTGYWRTITTSDLLKYMKGKSGRIHNLMLPLCDPIQFSNARELLIDPWLLGVYLGDGHFSTHSGNSLSCAITNSEKDIQRRVMTSAIHGDKVTLVSAEKRAPRLSFAREKKNNERSEMAQALLKYGLCDKGSSAKFIPADYLYADVESRVALLQGLVDTDGSVSPGTQTVEYTTTSQSLAEQVCFLVRSLGGIASLSVKKCVKYRYKGESLAGREAYRICIRFDNGIIPFTSEKHKKRAGSWDRRFFSGTGIQSIKKVRREECQCIKVAALDGLYITDDFIVTHNTTLARILAKELGCEEKLHYQEMNVSEEGGVDMVRGLSERAIQAPMIGDCRIWVLDEAAGLTLKAQNALLKILEEARPFAYFILCTTDPQKLLPTVINRCSRININAIDDDSMGGIIDRVLEGEKREIDPLVRSKIIEFAGGSARKALVKLEQCLAATKPQNMLALIQADEAFETEIKKLCEIFTGGQKATWRETAKIFDALTEDPETIRWSLLGWLSSAMLRGWAARNIDTQTLASCIGILQYDTFNSGKPGLALMVYECWCLTTKG